MNSALSSGTHHIFFPPRFELVVAKHQSDGLATHRLGNATAASFNRRKSNTPTGLACWRRPTDHGHNLDLLALVEPLLCPGPRAVMQGSEKSAGDITIAELPNGRGKSPRRSHHISDPPAPIQQLQDPSAFENAGRPDALVQHSADPLAIGSRETDSRKLLELLACPGRHSKCRSWTRSSFKLS